MNHRFYYEMLNITRIEIYKDGKESPLNPFLQTLDIREDSSDFIFFYNQFLRCFGKRASQVSPTAFAKDHFLICIDLGREPVLNPIDIEEGDYKKMKLVTGGTIDCNIYYGDALTEDYQTGFLSYYDAVYQFNAEGDDVSLEH